MQAINTANLFTHVEENETSEMKLNPKNWGRHYFRCILIKDFFKKN